MSSRSTPRRTPRNKTTQLPRLRLVSASQIAIGSCSRPLLFDRSNEVAWFARGYRLDLPSCRIAENQRPHRYRGLAAAGPTLVQTPALECAGRGSAAFRADETQRPAPRKQGALTLGLRSALLHKFRQTHASLKLTPVLQHRRTPREINDVSKSHYRLRNWASLVIRFRIDRDSAWD